MNLRRKRRLGDILIGASKINNFQLNEALKSQKLLGKKLGEVLIDLNILTEEEILDAIEEQTGIKKINLNEIGFDRRVIKLISQNLCEKYMLIPFDINENKIKVAMSDPLNIYVNLNEIGFDRRVIKLISQNLCEKYMLIPFDINENKIKVAMSDPLNIYAVDDLSISTGFEVESYISNKDDIKKFIQLYYSSEQMNKAAEELSRESLEYKSMSIEIEEIDDIKNAPVVKMIEYLFRNAVEMRASDIHIEPFENEVKIRYRIDGQLQTVNSLQKESLGPLVTRIKILSGLNITEKRLPQDGRIITRIDNQDVDLRVSILPKESLGPLVTRIKILSGLNITEKRLPQDGRIITRIDNQDVDLRVSILPVVNGEKVVIRILNRGSYKIDKKQLGMSEENLKKLHKIISKPNGIVLVTVPTGSGKSTTLYTILNELNSDNRNIVTIEDPVEYTMNGINQVNVNSKTGLTFAKGLRSILRQDPDIVMIGEIRDEETAKVAVKAAITGHLVLSTLHTNDAPSTITRLIDMGVEPYLVSTAITGVVAQRLVKQICEHCKLSTLHTNDAPSTITRLIDMGVEPYLVSTAITGVVAQRLVKQICEHCKESYESDIYEKSILEEDTTKPLTLYKGVGCGYCNNTGFKGRIGIYEIMEIEREHIYEKSILEEDTTKPLTLYKGVGCGYCNNTGFKGRIGIYEIMEIEREHRDIISTTNNVNILKDLAIKNGMATLKEECKVLVKSGVTTIGELLNVSM